MAVSWGLAQGVTLCVRGSDSRHPGTGIEALLVFAHPVLATAPCGGRSHFTVEGPEAQRGEATLSESHS